MVGEGLRPLEGPATPAPLQRLLDDCWRSDRAARPTAQQLVDALQQMLVRRRGSPVVIYLHATRVHQALVADATAMQLNVSSVCALALALSASLQPSN